MKHTVRTLSLAAVLAVIGVVALGSCAPAAPKVSKIAIVVKSLGNGFFDAVRDGGQEAAKELGNTEIIYQGPSTPTAEGQIEIIDSLIAQEVQGMAISANDRDALIPITRKAMSKGIKVISFDSGINKDGRIVDLVPSETQLIGKQQVKLVSELIGGEGEIAILSATSAATNHNAWIDVMKAELASNPAYSKVKLVATVYGDDLADKSYREAIGLLEAHPRLRGIIAPTTVGIAAAGKAITDRKLVGKVRLDGPRPALRDEVLRRQRRLRQVRALESDRPGLHLDNDHRRPHQEDDRRQGRRCRQGRPYGRHQDRRRRRRGHGRPLRVRQEQHRAVREDVLNRDEHPRGGSVDASD